MLDDLSDWMSRDEGKMPHIVTGKVIMNYNPLQPASVMVSIPDRPTGMNVTAWARVAMPFTGSGYGFFTLPNVGDEVVVAFVSGEIDRPIVIGSLYSLLKLPPAEALNPLNTSRGMKTPAGHTLKMDEITGMELTSVTKMGIKIDDLKCSLAVKDATGQTSVSIDGIQGTMSIKGLSQISLSAGACKITLDAMGQNVSIKAPMITLDALQSLTLKGQQVSVKGQLVSVEGNAQLEVKSAGITNVKGSMVKIN